jgi:rhodanese-related sulfurtransferase
VVYHTLNLILVSTARFFPHKFGGRIRARNGWRAINLPTYATKFERIDSLEGIPKDSRIVVYCQSKSCPYADSVAKTILMDGYRDVVVCIGGWADWQAEGFSR